MALIKFGAAVNDARGTLGGNVFSRNKAGAILRAKVTPTNPVSTYSSFARANFGNLAQAWGSELTQSQRSAWIAFAAVHPNVNIFGDSIILSGLSMFTAVNQRIMMYGGDRIDDPPATYSASVISSLAPVPKETTGALTEFTLGADVSGGLGGSETMWVFATVPQPPGRAVQRNAFRLVNGNTGASWTANKDFFADYNSRFNNVAVPLGAIIYVRAQVMDYDTGATGVPQFARCVAIADA